jgi:glyoxylase-like metal-dependent hydrolase (beta-lactamase superfamily II)
MLTIRTLPGAPLETNCYLVADVAAGEAIIVDAPKAVAEQVTRFCAALGVTARVIVCTHGHFDHTLGLPELMQATGAAVACHPLDAPMLEHPSFAPFNLPFPLTPVSPARLVNEGDDITVGSHRLRVLHTPGHTPGGICLYDAEDGVLFSGDTLFAGTCGRIDLPGGDLGQMMSSLHRLLTLPPATRVYPGHGPDTTIGRESHWLAAVDEMEEP